MENQLLGSSGPLLERCAHEQIAEQALKTPDAVAVVFEGRQLTYAELNGRANQLARELQGRGVGPEVLVGLCVERSLEMIVGLLGILKAGGAYLPLDPAYPSERLRFMVEDATVTVLLTQQHLLGRVPICDAQVFCLDQWDEMSKQSEENVHTQVTADNLAYVIYTSGSTGRPKGAMITHRNLCNMIVATTIAFDVREDSRTLQFASLSFDASVYEIFPVLCVGGTLCMARRETLMPGPSLVGLLRDLQITNVLLPPSVLALLPADEAFPYLRNIVSAGESCSVALARRWSKGRRLVNGYGPTETTVCVTSAEYVDGHCQKVTIGRPFVNTQLYVLDARMQPVPIGVAGELHIGGRSVGRGYLNRPDLTAEKFIRNPFSADDEDRLYKTGDLVRLLPNGEVEYLGRIDQQIKIRGFRVELGEIEETLLLHRAIREVVVMAREDVQGDKRLVAYVVPHEHFERPSSSDLRRFLQERLPDYMVPGAFVVVERFSLTPNGKVDRRALPAPLWERSDRESPFVAPRTALEETLVGIWQEVMGVEQVGIHDPFLDLGGHSLMAVQILARVRERLQAELPLQLLFHSATVAQMADEIEQLRQQGRIVETGSIPRVPRTADLPLSLSQERVWFIHRMTPGNLAYATQAMLRFHGPLRVDVLEQALQAIVARHESFRTTFHDGGERPIQRIHDSFDVHVPVVSLLGISEAEREAELQRLMQMDMQGSFDMSQLPLVRWTLFQINAEEHVLLHVEHHMIHDGWSFNVFLREFTTLYAAFLRGESSPSLLPELPIQFADFTSWQREWLKGKQAQEQVAYWQRKLSGCQPILELPTDHLRPALPSYRGSSVRIELPVTLTDALQAWSREEGVTLFVTLLAAFYLLLYRYTGQEDVLVGSGVANRRMRETEGLIGMIVNNVVLHAQMAQDLSMRELVRQVRETAFEAFTNEDLPFDKVVEAVNPVRDLSRNPLAQVMFSFHDSPMPHLHLPDVDVEIREVLSNGSAKFDLNVIGIPHVEPRRAELSDTGELVGLTMVWEYSTDLFAHATIERMVRHYQLLLGGLLTDATQKLSEFPLLTEAEQQQMLVAWNETQAEYPQEKCVHLLFEQQVERTPDAVAVVYSGQSLTYAELNGRANRLAHHLQKRGVGAETMVGLSLERSPDMVVGMLGILKAGGAYVPLDPAYPQERLAFLLEDSQVQVLVTQQSLLGGVLDQVALVVRLDADGDAIAQEADCNLPVDGTAEQLAYVIYTSGSTGKPKGVCVPHRAINRLVCNTNYVQLNPSDRVAQVSNTSFDAATFEIWGALLNGAQLVGITKDIALSPAAFAEEIKQQGITAMILTTALFNQMASTVPDAFASLRHLLFGGEAVDLRWVREVRQQGAPERLLHVYGPTESTTFATWHLVEEVPEDAMTIPIGRPLANTELYVLDRHRQPVPVGIPGELYIGGDGLAHGYWNRPELTAERFVPHPFKPETGERLYKTGDLVRYRADGSIEFLGRLDHQVKVRGFRIELEEIEGVLQQQADVQEAVVIVREDTPGDKRLTAYVVLRDGALLTMHDLRQFVKAQLPEYMVPALFVELESLPLTPNGKVDRRALPSPGAARPELTTDYVAPRSEIERTILAVWQEVLQVEKVGMYDNFFDLGGHSLLVIKVHSRLQDVLQTDFSIIHLFQYPTIDSLTQFLNQERMVQPTYEAAHVRARGKQDAINRRKQIQLDRGKSSE